MALSLTPKHHKMLQVADFLTQPILSPPKRQSWVFGLPKSGTTVFAKAIAVKTNQSILLDTPLLWGTSMAPLTREEVVSMRSQHPVTFSTRIVKEPNATMYPEAVLKAVPDSKHLLLVRSPTDNIRSHLDRVNIPGSATSIEGLDIPPAYRRFFEQNSELPPALALARRWKRVHEKKIWNSKQTAVFFYEDLVKKPEFVVEQAVQHLGLPSVNSVDSVFATQFQSRGRNRNAEAETFFGCDLAQEIRDITHPTYEQIKKWNFDEEYLQTELPPQS